jgi:hypothetical protein
MFERLVARVEDKAREAAEATRRNVEEALAQFPDVRLRRDGDTLVIEAMGLARRWLSDVRLRFAFWRRG